MAKNFLLFCLFLGTLSASEGKQIHPFKISVDQDIIDVLHSKLAATTWPNQIEPISDKWEQGTNLKYLKELAEYWQNHYDWRKHEEKLNQLDQFVTEIDGLDLHFIHIQSKRADATPLLFLHGWPGSILECTKVLPLLTHPKNASEPAFHVICPSLPGYGFSGKPTEFGWDPSKMASVFNQLMLRLNYPTYIAQGGDWGAIISTRIAELFPHNCIGLHINFHCTGLPWRRGIIPFLQSAGAVLLPSLFLTKEERENIKSQNPINAIQMTGYDTCKDKNIYYRYMHLQGTKPQSLSYGLSDSPVGLAGYIVEKFHGWSDCNGNIESRFTKDELLTNIMIYWVTNSMSSAVRLYWEFFQNEETIRWLGTQYVTVPTGYALFKDMQNGVSERFMQYNYNLVSFTQMPEGGHFAALEVPELLVGDIQKFYRIMNANKRKNVEL